MLSNFKDMLAYIKRIQFISKQQEEYGGILPSGPQKRKVLAQTGIPERTYDNFSRYRGRAVNKEVESLPKYLTFQI